MSDESVDIRIDNDDDLRSLTRWLRDEKELRGQLRLGELVTSPGQMGGAVDLLTVLVTSGTLATVVKSTLAWLGVRRKAEVVTLTFRNSAGDEMMVKCGSGVDAQRILDKAQSFLRVGA